MNQNDYQYRGGSSRGHNSDHNFRGGGLETGICPSGRCQCQTEDDDQNSAPERFPGQAVLNSALPGPASRQCESARGAYLSLLSSSLPDESERLPKPWRKQPKPKLWSLLK